MAADRFERGLDEHRRDGGKDVGKHRVGDLPFRFLACPGVDDGEEVGACGNASRCVAWLLMEASDKDAVTLETGGGVLKAWRDGPLRGVVGPRGSADRRGCSRRA